MWRNFLLGVGALFMCRLGVVQSQPAPEPGRNAVFRSVGMLPLELLNVPKNIEKQENLSSDCRETLLDILTLKKNWSLPMLDAMGKIPAGLMQGSLSFVGSYDQCLDVVASVNESTLFQGQYCVVSFKPADFSSVSTISKMTKGFKVTGFTPAWHTCFPSTCKTQEVVLASNIILGSLGLNFTNAICETKASVVFDQSQYVALAVFSVLGILIVFGTVVDVALSISKKLTSPDATVKENGKIIQGFLAFSVNSNARKILNVDTSSDTLGVLHGMRFLSMAWVILGHTYSFPPIFLIGNLNDGMKKFQAFEFQAVANGTLCVDVFFFISGLLLTYVAMKEFKRKGKINWFLFYFHRIWRLTPALGLCILSIFLIPLLDSGPLWKIGWKQQTDMCRNYWWTTLLYINNLFEHEKANCIAQSWYSANDMQFYVISPLILYLLWRWPKAGLLANFAFLTASSVAPALLIMKYDLHPTILAQAGPNERRDHMYYVYKTPWCRMGTYCIGIYIGYLLSEKRKFKIPVLVQMLMWSLSFAVWTSVVYGTYEWNNNNSSPVEINALYGATHRIAFTLGIAWMTYACCTGYGGIINDILSWKVFIPLGRMTYMAYLLHLFVINAFNFSLRERIMFTHFYQVVTYLGFLVMTYGIAFVASICFETPFINMEKIFLSPLLKNGQRVHANNSSLSNNGIKTTTFSKSKGEPNAAFDDATEDKL